MRILLALIFIFCLDTAMAQVSTPKIQTTLLSDHQQVRPGQSFYIGVLFEIEEGWHIYWKYPGDAGLPTLIRWSLPEGFEVGELLWPVPKRFVQEGNIKGYGYENSVMLMAKVTAPDNFNGDARISADVRWLACRDICVPGRTNVATNILIRSDHPVPSNTQTFAQWLERLPAMDTDVRIERRGLNYTLRVKGITNGDQLEVFVSPPDGVEVMAIKTEGELIQVNFSRLAGAQVEGMAEVVIVHPDFNYSVKLSFH